jgi:hypothetical protein
LPLVLTMSTPWSDTNSIYDAERASSTEDFQSESSTGSWRLSSSSLAHDEPAIINDENTRLRHSQPTRASSIHVHRQLPLLDTILEQNIPPMLRPSASAPRLQPSPQKSARVVEQKGSFRSIHPPQHRPLAPWPLPQPLPGPNMDRYMSASSPDLTSKCMDVFRSPCPSRSSASSQILRSIPQNPAEPAKPAAGSMERRPTPEGLPSFGSKEAQRLRMRPEPALRRGTRAILEWMRSDRMSQSQDGAVTSRRTVAACRNSSGASTRPQPQTQTRTVPMDMLQRLFGTPRVVNAPDSNTSENYVQRPTASLPRYVTRASSPGVLTAAADGTYVRGRFSARMSAHGATRGLDWHPLAVERKWRGDGSQASGHGVTAPSTEVRMSEPRPYAEMSLHGTGLGRADHSHDQASVTNEPTAPIAATRADQGHVGSAEKNEDGCCAVFCCGRRTQDQRAPFSRHDAGLGIGHMAGLHIAMAGGAAAS